MRAPGPEQDDRQTPLQQRIAAVRRHYVRQLPERVAELESAWHAIGADGARHGAVERVFQLVHTLRGSAATFGLEAISAAAERADECLRQMMGGESSITQAQRECLQRSLEELKFRVSAAVESAPEASVQPWMTPLQAAQPPGPVLVVAGDPWAGRELLGQLGYFGYPGEVETRLETARQLATRRRFTALIVDLGEPEHADAHLRMVRELRRDMADPPPVIFTAERDDMRARLQATRLGGVAYLVRPVDVAAIVDKLDEISYRRDDDPYRVLIVDDSRTSGFYISNVLEEAGMVTQVVRDPLQALDALAEFGPELILMDLYLAEFSGFETAAAIRQNETYVGTPIVFLSSETDVDKQLHALRQGGDDFLTKPIRPEHLVAAVAIRAERYRQLRGFMVRDGLTGLYNHSRIKQELELAVSRGRRHRAELTFAMVDIDEFKAVNDAYGHPVGDRIIKGLARLLRQRLRTTDIIGRYGGEEFALILDNTGVEAALAVLEDIRENFARLAHRAGAHEFSATFSCGLAGFPRFSTAPGISEAADRALYRAKAQGRNRVVVEDESS